MEETMYVLYDTTDSEEYFEGIADKQLMTKEEADRRNKRLREEKSDLRWIKDNPTPKEGFEL